MPSQLRRSLLAENFDVALDDLVLVNLPKESGHPFGEGDADRVQDVEAQTIELNKLLRLRITELERNLTAYDPDLAKDLGIELGGWSFPFPHSWDTVDSIYEKQKCIFTNVVPT